MGDLADDFREMREFRKKRATKILVNCQNCGKVFNSNEADKEKGWHKFCSKECRIAKKSTQTNAAAPILYHRKPITKI